MTPASARSLLRRLARLVPAAFALAVPFAGCSKYAVEDAPPVDEGTWRDPEVLTPDANGVIAIAMKAAKVTIDNKDYCLRTYNGKLSPMIDAKVTGQPRRIRVDVSNDFILMDEQPLPGKLCGNPDAIHHFNVTNFHTHGLHVPPERTLDGAFQADNVLLAIHPRSAPVQFRFDLDEPKAHEAGTYWFHSHVHGSTSIQVANGMVGAFIVRGAVDELPGIREARERVFLFQQIPYDWVDPDDPTKSVKPLEGECNETKLSIDDFLSVTEAKHTLTNGVLHPTIKVHKNAVERWRFIHGGISEEIAVGLRKLNANGTCDYRTADDLTRAIPLTQIAADGFTYVTGESSNALSLVPGNRADVMMKAPAEPGRYCVVDVAEAFGLNDVEDGKVLAYLDVDDVEAPAASGAIPSDADLTRVARPVLDCNAPLTTKPRPMVFAQQKDPVTKQLCGGLCKARPFFNVNCTKFDANAPPTVLPFGQTEEWLLSAEWTEHPFHIHVNAFTVCPGGTIRGKPITTPHWKDTIFIRTADTAIGMGVDTITTNPIRIRTTYEDFKGKFVMHCHKLQHEDEGMMQTLEIR